MKRRRGSAIAILLVSAGIAVCIAIRSNSEMPTPGNKDDTTKREASKGTAPTKERQRPPSGDSRPMDQRMKLVSAWSPHPSVEGQQFEPGKKELLLSLIASGEYEKALELAKTLGDPTTQSLSIQLIWLEWGKVDREKAREAISSEQLPASLRSAAAVGLFGAIAITSSEGDVRWVAAWVSSIKDALVVKSLGHEVSQAWIATGLLPPEQYIGWAKGIPGARMADWVQNLESAARVAEELQKRGKLEKSELLDLSVSIARAILSIDAGPTKDQSGKALPYYSEIQTKKSQVFGRLGDLAGQMYGLGKLSDYSFPQDEIAAISYAAGIGKALKSQSPSDVYRFVSADQDSISAQKLWFSYWYARVPDTSLAGIFGELSTNPMSDTFQQGSVDAIIAHYTDADHAALAEEIRHLPEGDLRDRFSKGMAQLLKGKGLREEARVWE